MCEQAVASEAFATVLPPFTRSSGLDWRKDVLESPTVTSVYVCTPDHLHHEHAIACLEAGKHVLVEKPLYQFEQVAAAAANPAVCSSNFNRRGWEPRQGGWHCKTVASKRRRRCS